MQIGKKKAKTLHAVDKRGVPISWTEPSDID
jgi:hypothetical protein